MAKTQLWPGIDIDIPTAASSADVHPPGDEGGGTGRVSRRLGWSPALTKYSEIKLANLRGAGAAVKELGFA